ATQQGVSGAVHGAHPARAEVLLERVLTELPCRENRVLCFYPSPLSNGHKRKHEHGGCNGYAEQRPEYDPQHVELAVRFRHFDFGGHSKPVLGYPGPGADHWNASVITITFDIDTSVACNCILRHSSQGLVLTSALSRPFSLRQVDLWVPHLQRKNGLSVRQVGQEPDPLQIIIETTHAQEHPILVERVRFTRFAGLGNAQDLSQLKFWPYSEPEYADPDPVVIGQRGGGKHCWQPSLQFAFTVSEQQPATKRNRHRRSTRPDHLFEKINLVAAERFPNRRILISGCY